jgi:hypothetical protein
MLRSPEIHTPTTPYDAGNVSDEPGFVVDFDCIVTATSGDTLGTFRCDEATSVGWIRNQVSKVFAERQRPNTYVRTGLAVRLMRVEGEQILQNDYTKIHTLRETKQHDCRLSAVCMSTVRSR